jgi:hypothetical protein
MLIANPIYDSIFKAAMQKKRLAKFFIGTLLEQEVLDVDFRPQETVYTDERNRPRIFRVDFAAIIKTDDGNSRKILIEVQKALVADDIWRFRRYLGEHYSMRDGDSNNDALPLVTVYILGFDMPDFPYPCVKVGREYIDLLNHRPIKERNKFLERVTHDSYVVQVGSIPDRRGQSRLEELLAIFEQKNFADPNKRTKSFDGTLTDNGANAMLRELNYLITDPETQHELDMETEAIRVENLRLQPLQKQLKDKDAALAQKDAALAQKDAALAAALSEIDRMKKDSR